MTPSSMLAHLAENNGIAWEDLDADTAKALRAMLSDSTPSSTVAKVSGAEPAAGEGVPQEERRACWTCHHARTPADCSHDWTEEIGTWIRANCPGYAAPSADARDCPGWAPKLGEVSDG